MRHFTIVFSVVILSLTMLAGSLPASAKPGSGNSPSAKLCQKGGYATLATSEDPHTAFATEEACVSYAAKGGVLVDYTPHPLSQGCSVLARTGTVVWTGAVLFDFPFFEGERLTLAASEPAGGATWVEIGVNGSIVASATGFPAEISYDIPADGVLASVLFWVGPFGGNALLDIGCFRP